MKYRRMDEDKRQQLHKAALLIRFRTDEPTTKSRKYASYRLIAKILNLTCYEVEHICRKSILPKKELTINKQIRKLDKEHLNYLLSQRTLE